MLVYVPYRGGTPILIFEASTRSGSHSPDLVASLGIWRRLFDMQLEAAPKSMSPLSYGVWISLQRVTLSE